MDSNANIWLDLIIIVIVGLFVYSRFFASRLPRDDGKSAKNIREAYGKKPTEAASNVVQAPITPKPRRRSVNPEDLEKLQGAERLRAVDPSFDENSFLEGAKSAYTLFYEARTARDMTTLESLVAPRLLDDILDDLESKTSKASAVNSVDAAEVVDARINGRTLIVEVKYRAQHKEAGKNKALQQVWTWARNADADDPNWELELMRPVS